MIAAVRTMGMIALVAAAFVYLFAPGVTHRVLDPNDPIAADGSLIAGHARTIFDTEPALGAFRQPRPDFRRSGGFRAADQDRHEGGRVGPRAVQAPARAARLVALHRRRPPMAPAGGADLLRHARPGEIHFLAARPARQGRDRKRMVDARRPGHRRLCASRLAIRHPAQERRAARQLRGIRQSFCRHRGPRHRLHCR